MSTNNNIEFQIDDKEVRKMFLLLLNKREQNKSIKQGLRKSANIIAKQTRKNLRKAVKGATQTGRYGKMIKGVKTSISKKMDNAKVHIMGDFRLKFFEKGTQERHLRKNDANRGKITPTYFFKQAVDEKYSEAIDSLKENLKQSIQKIYDKK